MGLDYEVGRKSYKRVGTYSEAAYFSEWLKMTGIEPLPISEGVDITPEQAEALLVAWVPQVQAALNITKCKWAGEEPPEEYRLHEDGNREIAPKEYPLLVYADDETAFWSGIVSPGGFRCGCPPQEFLEVIGYIAQVSEWALRESVKSQRSIKWR